MLLHLLTQLNFRNLQSPRLHLEAGLTVITGANGAGKSNLLSACYLSMTGVLPFGRIADAVTVGNEQAFVSARFSHADGESLVEVGLAPGRKLIRLDGNAVRTEQLAAVAAAVLITPEDAQLVHGPPAGRRSWLDSLLARMSQRYARIHAEYVRVLTQRNALLRSGYGDSSLGVWSDRFVVLGSELEQLRARAMTRITELAAGAYFDITEGGASPGRRELTLQLASHGRAPLAEALPASQAEEQARGVTVVGPHRDDLILELGGLSVQAYGSRGEARTVALALKVAEFRLLAERHGEEPLLLIDDFSAELDEDRRGFLLGLASSVPQVLATSTDPPDLPFEATHITITAGTLKNAG